MSSTIELGEHVERNITNIFSKILKMINPTMWVNSKDREDNIYNLYPLISFQETSSYGHSNNINCHHQYSVIVYISSSLFLFNHNDVVDFWLLVVILRSMEVVILFIHYSNNSVIFRFCWISEVKTYFIWACWYKVDRILIYWILMLVTGLY